MYMSRANCRTIVIHLLRAFACGLRLLGNAMNLADEDNVTLGLLDTPLIADIGRWDSY